MLLVGVRTCHAYLSTATTSTATTSPTAACSSTDCTRVPVRWFSLCSSLLEQCWAVWSSAEQAARARAAEEDSLYRYRTKTHLITGDEEGEGEGVVRQMFPVYDCEFEERVEEEGGEGEEEGEMEGDVEGDIGPVCQFSSREMEEVSSLHLLLFATTRSHTCPDSCSVAGSSRYSLAATLATIAGPTPGETTLAQRSTSSLSISPLTHANTSGSGLSTDYCLFGGHALMCKKLLSDLTQQPTGKEK